MPDGAESAALGMGVQKSFDASGSTAESVPQRSEGKRVVGAPTVQARVDEHAAAPRLERQARGRIPHGDLTRLAFDPIPCAQLSRCQEFGLCARMDG